MFAWAERQIIYIKNKTNKREKIMLSYYISDNRHPTKTIIYDYLNWAVLVYLKM